MKKLFNKRLADYNLKDLTAITGLTILAMPVICAGCMAPFYILEKIGNWKEKKIKEKAKEKMEWSYAEEEEEP